MAFTIPTEFTLNDPPTDGITAVKFGPESSNFLLASSWDKSVRLYDVTKNKLRMEYQHDAAVLDCCFTDAVHGYSGSLDRVVKTYDFNTSAEKIIGSHDKPIRCVEYCPSLDVVVTGSWDSTVKIWDPRQAKPTSTSQQHNKVQTMAICEDRLVVGTAGRKILVWDMRNMGIVQQKRDSSLKFQTRCIRCFPNKQGFVLSTIEGRVAVEYFDPSPEVQKKRYAFKCHRMKSDGIENIYPVNAVAFHNIHNTFATGGSDGIVNIWDGFNKKRLCQFHVYPTSIASLSFSQDGTVLAIASSYMHEQGEKEHPADAIYIRHVSDAESKPK